MALALDVLLWLIAGAWLWTSVKWALDLLAVPLLPALDEPPAGPLPRVSVIVAARDEAERIETTVQRLLGQRDVDLELIVVDDRSVDGTGEILARLSRDDARLRVLRVDALPDGWIGKCHALQTGGAAAGGDWILFTDADMWLAPDLIARAVRAAETERADHVSLFPHQREVRLSGRVAGLLFSMLLFGNAAGVNRDRKRAFFGVGAFNLVRSEAYRALGGHEPLRLEICDDIKLGLLLSRAGRRSRAYVAGHDLEAAWARTAAELVAALEKNMFAMLGFSVPLALAAVTLNLVLWGGAVLGPLTGRPAGFAAALAWLTLALPASRISVAAGWGWPPALLAPFGFPVLPLVVFRSMWTTLRHGGVRWRDTFYPLEVLRRGRVRWP